MCKTIYKNIKDEHSAEEVVLEKLLDSCLSVAESPTLTDRGTNLLCILPTILSVMKWWKDLAAPS